MMKNVFNLKKAGEIFYSAANMQKYNKKIFTWEYRDDRKGSLSIVNIKHVLDPVSSIAVFCLPATQQW